MMVRVLRVVIAVGIAVVGWTRVVVVVVSIVGTIVVGVCVVAVVVVIGVVVEIIGTEVDYMMRMNWMME